MVVVGSSRRSKRSGVIQELLGEQSYGPVLYAGKAEQLLGEAVNEESGGREREDLDDCPRCGAAEHGGSAFRGDQLLAQRRGHP